VGLHNKMLCVLVQGLSRLQGASHSSNLVVHSWSLEALRHMLVQSDAVCELGGSAPDLSYGDLGIVPEGDQTERTVQYLRNNRRTGNAPSNQPRVAGGFPQRNLGT